MKTILTLMMVGLLTGCCTDNESWCGDNASGVEYCRDTKEQCTRDNLAGCAPYGFVCFEGSNTGTRMCFTGKHAIEECTSWSRILDQSPPCIPVEKL